MINYNGTGYYGLKLNINRNIKENDLFVDFMLFY